MLQKFEVVAIHTELDPKLKAYVDKKIGQLDKYIPRHSRVSAHGEVHLKELKVKSNDRFRCTVTFYLPHQTIIIKETALNFYAAIDIAEVKLKQQLAKYKETHTSGKARRHLFARLNRRS